MQIDKLLMVPTRFNAAHSCQGPKLCCFPILKLTSSSSKVKPYTLCTVLNRESIIGNQVLPMHTFKVLLQTGISPFNSNMFILSREQIQQLDLLRSSKGIKTTIFKINKFSIFTGICPKYYCAQLSFAKTSCGEIQLQ